MSILETTAADLENGVTVLPAVGADNVLRILVTNHKYRLERTTTITITLPASVVTDSPLTYYLIDRTHSNYYDTGSGDGSLEIVASPSIVDGTLTLTMEPRSVHLLVFAPSPAGGGAIEMKKIGKGAWQAVAADVPIAGSVERKWIPGQGWRTVAADQDQGTGAVERQKRPSAPWLNVPADEGV